MPRTKSVTDDELLDAAARAVARCGPMLTLRDVAVEARLTAPAVALRFGSKRALLLALVQRDITTLPDRFERERSRHPNALQALVAALVGLARGITTPVDLANHLAFLHLDLSDPEFHALARKHAETVRQQVSWLIETALADGELAGADPARLAHHLQIIYNGTLLTWGLHGHGSLSRELRRQVTAALSEGLAPAES
jgi:AcrR family transcriptional regulator